MLTNHLDGTKIRKNPESDVIPPRDLRFSKKFSYSVYGTS